MSFKFKFFTISSIIASVILVDQLLKNWAVRELMGRPARVYLDGLFQLVYGENTGAFLGMGGEWSRSVRFGVFAVLVAIGLGAMLWYLFKRENSKANIIAYSFILGGGFGNLGDRLFNEKGHVVDFLYIEIAGPIRTGIFNFADIAIVFGVLIAFYFEYVTKKDRKSLH